MKLASWITAPFSQRQVQVSAAPAQGVSLSKAGDPVVAVERASDVVYRPTVIIAGVPRWERVWATPRADIAEWISSALAEGDYASAAHLSAYLHGAVRVPDLSGAVILPSL
jgi:hypothetical protein